MGGLLEFHHRQIMVTLRSRARVRSGWLQATFINRAYVLLVSN